VYVAISGAKCSGLQIRLEGQSAMPQTRHDTSPTTTAETDATAATDAASVAAIHRLVADAERLQNDVDGFTGLLTDDAVIVNFGGRRVRGRDVIRQVMRAALETPLADVITTQQVEDIRFLRPDVALVDCVKLIHDRRDPSDPATTQLADRGMLTFVVVEQRGEWRIASAQTTPVAA
jgi:uncharacterized protein (TIGR02246 family)